MKDISSHVFDLFTDVVHYSRGLLTCVSDAGYTKEENPNSHGFNRVTANHIVCSFENAQDNNLMFTIYKTFSAQTSYFRNFDLHMSADAEEISHHNHNINSGQRVQIAIIPLEREGLGYNLV